jgi:hypothetical protein
LLCCHVVRLTALEREEAAYAEQVKAAVLSEAPEPLGLVNWNDAQKRSGSTITPSSGVGSSGSGSNHLRYPPPMAPAPDVNVRAVPNRPSFWEQYRGDIEQLRNNTSNNDDNTSDIEDDDEEDDDDHKSDEEIRTVVAGRPSWLSSTGRPSHASSAMDVSQDSPSSSLFRSSSPLHR